MSLCYETCEAFKQRYICSHTVAAAEDNKMLVNFIDKYALFSKTAKGHQRTTPNFTRLSMSNLPRRTAGQKGGKPPKKKAICRRKTTSSEHRQPLLQTASGEEEASTSGYTASDSADTEHSPSTPGPSTSTAVTVITSSGNWNWNWDNVPSYSMAYHAPPPPPPYTGGMFYPPYPGYSAYGCPPLADVTNYSTYAPSFPYPSNSSSSQPPRTGASGPFIVKFLNQRIKVCGGCNGPYLKGVDNKVLPPPNDICILHTEPLKYINPRTGLESSKIGNAYYHINSACIRKKHPDFSSSLVSCSKDDVNLMQPSHFKLLYDSLGYVMH